MAGKDINWHNAAYEALLKASALCHMSRAYFEMDREERPSEQYVVTVLDRVARLIRGAMPPGEDVSPAATAMRDAMGQAAIITASCIRAKDSACGQDRLQFIEKISVNAIWSLNDDIDAAKDLVEAAA